MGDVLLKGVMVLGLLIGAAGVWLWFQAVTAPMEPARPPGFTPAELDDLWRWDWELSR